ncbi:DUF4837 family protein [Labilibacter sediminis]|nr:DUF4837 family protein [Labilibacter sediminis]
MLFNQIRIPQNMKLSNNSLKVFVLTLFIYLYGCDMHQSNSKGRAIGAPGELLLVMDNDLQNSEVKSLLVDFARDEFPCIPQPEPTFKMTTITPTAFEGHFKAYRNIIIVNQNKSGENDIQYQKDVWASHQQVLKVTIDEVHAFASLFSNNRNKIFDFLYYGDIKSMQKANLNGADAATKDFIKSRYGINMVLPRGYRLVKDTLNFSWFRFDKLETIQSVVLHSFDMPDVESLNCTDLVALRDSVCKTYIPGPYAKSYMVTEKALPVLIKTLKINNTEVIEIRGLWKVNGYFMGGPFVDYFIKDEKQNKLIMIEGFVYAPKKQNKAYYVRQIESILHSMDYL